MLRPRRAVHAPLTMLGDLRSATTPPHGGRSSSASLAERFTRQTIRLGERWIEPPCGADRLSSRGRPRQFAGRRGGVRHSWRRRLAARRTAARRRPAARHGPAGAALRQPQDRPGEPARGPVQGPPHRLGVPARRAAGRDRRRVRDLAPHPRRGGHRGLGAALAAVGPPHRPRHALGQGRGAADCRSTSAPDERAEVVARLQPGVIANVRQCTGTWCRIVVPADGRPRPRRLSSARTGSGASIRTRRSSRAARSRRIGADPASSP